MIEWVQPRNTAPCGSCIAGTIQCAEHLSTNARPVPSGKKRV